MKLNWELVPGEAVLSPHPQPSPPFRLYFPLCNSWQNYDSSLRKVEQTDARRFVTGGECGCTEMTSSGRGGRGQWWEPSSSKPRSGREKENSDSCGNCLHGWKSQGGRCINIPPKSLTNGAPYGMWPKKTSCGCFQCDVSVQRQELSHVCHLFFLFRQRFIELLPCSRPAGTLGV